MYFTEDPKDARVLLDKAIIGWKSDEVEEMRSLGQHSSAALGEGGQEGGRGRDGSSIKLR
jgi:hypothetical protein